MISPAATLDSIGLKNKTDKASTGHDYLTFYDERLSRFRDDSFLMIEIGVFRGGSLATWGEYFPKATIVGIDVDPSTSTYASSNRKVVVADATRLETVDSIVNAYGPPSIVLDDGSHFHHHQIMALHYFWPKILPGGCFIMEDLHSSMPALSAEYAGDSRISCYDYLLWLNRYVVGARYMADERPFDGFISNYYRTVRSIDWYRGTCIMWKQPDDYKMSI